LVITAAARRRRAIRAAVTITPPHTHSVWRRRLVPPPCATQGRVAQDGRSRPTLGRYAALVWRRAHARPIGGGRRETAVFLIGR